MIYFIYNKAAIILTMLNNVFSANVSHMAADVTPKTSSKFIYNDATVFLPSTHIRFKQRKTSRHSTSFGITILYFVLDCLDFTVCVFDIKGFSSQRGNLTQIVLPTLQMCIFLTWGLACFTETRKFLVSCLKYS